MEPIRGSCLCKGVAFEIISEPRVVLHCHCSRCRKVRGTAHATNLATAADGVRFVRGEDLLTRFKAPDAKRFAHVFCKVCGSSLPNVDTDRGMAIVPMGSLDDDPGIRPQAHIWVGSKATWEEITDSLPQMEEGPQLQPDLSVRPTA